MSRNTQFFVKIHCCAWLLICLAPHVAQAMSSSYNTMYQGDATYYGESNGGNCVLRNPVPSMYSGMVPVAMNGVQYENSELCGACLRVFGDGEGSGGSPVKGEFTAFVADKCPECKHGDIDLSKSGDGRWKVRWELIKCPNSGDISFYFEGSNPFYYKVQPRGLPSPATKVMIGGIQGRRSDDNFYIAENGASFQNPVNIQVWTLLGDYYESSVSGYTGTVQGSGGTKNSPQSGSPEKSAGQTYLKQENAACTPDYARCAGAPNHPYVQYVGCCGQNFECVESTDIGWGKQCRPKGY